MLAADALPFVVPVLTGGDEEHTEAADADDDVAGDNTGEGDAVTATMLRAAAADLLLALLTAAAERETDRLGARETAAFEASCASSLKALVALLRGARGDAAGARPLLRAVGAMAAGGAGLRRSVAAEPGLLDELVRRRLVLPKSEAYFSPKYEPRDMRHTQPRPYLSSLHMVSGKG